MYRVQKLYRSIIFFYQAEDGIRVVERSRGLGDVYKSRVYVGPDNTGAGILLQPGGSFETAIAPGSDLFVTGTAGQIVSVVQYA